MSSSTQGNLAPPTSTASELSNPTIEKRPEKTVNLLNPLGHHAETKHAVSSPPEPVQSGQCIPYVDPDETIATLTVNPAPSAEIAQDAITTASISVPTIQVQENSATSGPLRQDTFPKNVNRPTITTQLPRPCARIERTTQLVYACSMFTKAQSSPPASDIDVPQDSPLDETQQEWIQLIDPIEKSRLQGLLEQLVRAFAGDELKVSAAIAEIVLLGSVLNRETYRALLSCFICALEQMTLLDNTLLQGLVQLVEGASSGYFVDDDLVRIVTFLFKELKVTHTGASDHPLLLTLALARILDVMVAGKVKNLNRGRDHQPMLQLLDDLKGSGDSYLKHQAAYAHQALQYVPDDETPLQAMWRVAQQVGAGASAVSSVFKLDLAGFLESHESIQEIGVGMFEAAKTSIETLHVLRDGVRVAVRASEVKFDFMKKHSWYLALQGTALFIRQGRLSDFNQIVCQAPCRHDVNFQWGICRRVGEIDVDSIWDAEVRCQAVAFLGELYRSNTDWKPYEDVKRWIHTILAQISALDDPYTQESSLTLLEEIAANGAAAFPGMFPLSARLPLPVAFPLIARVEEITEIDYDLHKLKIQRLEEYKQEVYIAPMAKLNPQAPDDNVLPLMGRVEEFLDGNAQVMLILGGSGAGKSTFNRHLEYQLWQRFKAGDRVPLFVNLPAIDRAERDLLGEHLQSYNFSEEQLRELKLYRRVVLICDGYDESQPMVNVHTTNTFNQPGQWDVKLLITCRTQYLGPDYRDRFAPKATDHYHRAATDLFQEAVIAPFSKTQIELCVDKYIPLNPEPGSRTTTWTSWRLSPI